jgi:uncharacterized membrane protein (UPF0127 family)
VTRIRLAALVVVAAAVLVVGALLAGTLAGSSDAVTRATLTVNGDTFRPELALDGDARARGLMHRRRAPKDGMLFVFPGPSTGGFWMKNTLVPLRIVFFDSHGVRVRAFTMKPCRKEPCRYYDPNRSYRFALELGATDRRPATRLGPRAALRGLMRRAS